MLGSVAIDVKVAIQMRLSNPLLLASLGVMFVSASCTLITDVDRSKIPDGTTTGGTLGAGGDVTSPDNNGGVPALNVGGAGGEGELPLNPGGTSAGGAFGAAGEASVQGGFPSGGALNGGAGADVGGAPDSGGAGAASGT